MWQKDLGPGFQHDIPASPPLLHSALPVPLLFSNTTPIPKDVRHEEMLGMAEREKVVLQKSLLKIKQNKRTKKLAGTPLLPALWSALETRLVYSVSSRDIQGNPVSKNQKMKPKPNKSDQPTTTKTITACQSPRTPAHPHGLLDMCIS